MRRIIFLLLTISLYTTFLGVSGDLRRKRLYRRTYESYYEKLTATPTPSLTPTPTRAPTPEPTPAPDEPCNQEYLLFDFTTTESASEVKKRFENLTVPYSFKGIGTCRYIIVVVNDQSDHLKALTLPDDASLNVEVTPVETVTQYLARFGVFFRPTELIPLPDKDLVMIERVWFAQGLNEDQYAAALAKQVRNVVSQSDSTVEMTRRVDLVAGTSLPTRLLFFWNRDDCGTAGDILNNSDPLGGIDGTSTKLLRLINI